MNYVITDLRILTENDIILVHEFCHKCKKLGYDNNSSLKSMKWEFATWFAHFSNDKIISLSGVHEFLDGYRIMFRGATLPGKTNKFLNKEQAIEQMKYFGNSNYYFTLNCSDKTGSKSNRLRKIVHSGKGWKNSTYVTTDDVYGVIQEIWKI